MLQHRRRTAAALLVGLVTAGLSVAQHTAASTEPDEPAAPTHLVGRSPFGRIITAADGRSLYVFGNDSAGESTCLDDCATNWPPFLADEVPALDGVDPALLSLVERPDGNVVAVDGLPLYYFAGDAAPGDLNGQGVGDVWWLVSPDGTPIETTEPVFGLSVESTPFGDVIVDQAGSSLYMFAPDSGGESTCVDDCQAKWPPLFAEEIPALDGIDPAAVSLVERPDGNVVAVGGWPLYYFAGDAAPGDLNGQGVGDVWWLLTPAGEPIQSTEPVVVTTTAMTDDGY